MIQLVFSDAIFPLPGAARQLSALVPAGWGFAALASTARLNNLYSAMGMPAEPQWNHSRSTWLIAMGMMAAWSAVYILLAWWLLNRRSPGRRRYEWPLFLRRLLRSA